MKLTDTVLGNPIAGYVIIAFVIIFGSMMSLKLPIQLTPEISPPEITITTTWRAAAPEEVEAEIIEPQENALKGLPGLVEMLSEAQRGRASITLQFNLDMDLQRALIEVLNRLNRVPSYPVDADEPILSTVGDRTRPIAWFIIKPAPGNETPIAEYQRFLEETAQPAIEQVWGVSKSEIRGGLDQEIRITVDPYKAASFGIDLPALIRSVAVQEDISAGTKDSGKRQYTIRFEGAFDLSSLGDMVVAWRDGKTVRLRDIAEIDLLPEDLHSFVMNKGSRAIAMNAYRESGVNVIEVMQRLQQVIAKLATGPLQRNGLTIEQVYDETVYIEDSMQMLFSNLGIGILLAGFVLWFFARRLRLTLIVAASIPVSLFAALVVLQLTGRTLNVISLAALALSVGMVLDASIIAIENILRLKESGHTLRQAARQGIAEIQPALVASTATTVAIFLPIILLQGEVGQLFADLALGLSVAIVASLFVAVVLVPMLGSQWLGDTQQVDTFADKWERITNWLMSHTETPKQRKTLIVILLALPIVLTVLLLPKADYLPAGNRNLIFAFLLPPPGMNVATMKDEIGEVIIQRLDPHLRGEKSPAIKNYFFVAFSRGAFLGAQARDAAETKQLVPVINQVFRDVPDTLAFAQRASLFSQGDTRAVDLNLQARNIESLLEAARTAYGLIAREIPGARVNPRPGLELADAQFLLIPNEERIAEAGWTREMVGQLARASGQGLFLNDYFDGDKNIDVIGRITGWQTMEDLAAIPFATPQAGVLPFGELVHIKRGAGPERIRRLDRRRTITLEVIAPPHLPLEVTAQLLKEKVEPVLWQQLPEDASITYGGSANKLSAALINIGSAFLFAILILYLLISVLFRSFRDSLLVVISLPLATVGGMVMLKLINLLVFQPLDLLTMIGFIILLGLVVNNAILLVHQARLSERNGMGRRDAVRQAIRFRLRPIFMSTLTSLFGMLPLLLAFGAGAELYRGLAGVIVGGLLVSTLFTLLLLPCLLRSGESSVPAPQLTKVPL